VGNQPREVFHETRKAVSRAVVGQQGGRPKEHVRKSPKKPGVKEKNKTQRKAIQHDLGKLA
jgi:hypothetical protein